MNKVICDICGTAYPDTAPKCPICGYAKIAAETTVAASERRSSEGYTAVKGGRFSKQNVRKRTSNKVAERSNSDRARRNEQEEGSNTGLVLVVIFLLVAIVAVVIYIGLKVFRAPDSNAPQPTGTSQVTQPTTEPNGSADPTVPTTGGTACTELKLSNQTIEFVNAGDTWTIQVRPTPADTTDTITFESSAPEVVTVDETGLLTAVGSGEATITVTCGTITETCQIKCSFDTPIVPPTDPATDPSAPTGATVNPTAPTGQDTTNPTTATTPTVPAGSVDPNFTFEFATPFKDGDKWDTSIHEQGKTWKAYKNNLSVDPGAITWTSDDPSICTVQNGVVTAVAPGKTEVHATYGGKTYTCIIRCRFEADETATTPTEPATEAPTTSTEPTTNGATTPTTPAPVDPNFTFEFDTPFKDGEKWDTTLQSTGETWRAYKKNMEVDPGDITWTTDNASVCTIEDGVVTAVGSGKTEIHATYGGKTYTCILRVK